MVEKYIDGKIPEDIYDRTLAELRTQYGVTDLEDIFVRVVEGRP